MKRIILILITFLVSTSYIWSQEHNVRIEIQLVGYDGFSPFKYSISDGNYFNNYSDIKPDSSGRVVLLKKIDSTKFFHFHFRNSNEQRTFYECRLVLEPDNSYSIICKSHKYDDYNVPYSPDIYSWKIQNGDQPTHYKMNMGQMYYNLFDNATEGYLYNEEWNLLEPDSLLKKLESRTNKQAEIYTSLLNSGDITKEFYDIAKLNVEYFNAYRLAITIKSTWVNPRRYGIKDSLINNQLINVYKQLFKRYPVEKTKLEDLFLSERFIDVYLFYLESFKNGSFSVPKRGTNWRSLGIEEIKPFISPEVYKNYKMRNMMSFVGSLELESSKLAKKFMASNPDMKQTMHGNLLENVLIPRSEEFDSLAQRELPGDVIFLDEEEPIQLYSQLVRRLNNKPVLINFWGSWCGPCKYQFKFKDSLKSFLDENGIELIYAAYEYSPDREKWKKIIAAYELSGNHLMISDSFKNDLKKYGGEITGYPTFMLINDKGEIVEPKAFLPSDGNKLIKQIEDKLMNNLR
ncbi:MAG TPA: TlpA family protein disulfide reductase [Draconibacterium sp.]|nr:TlpA family protein disulfide reductase [Draconibacterium sp.]